MFGAASTCQGVRVAEKDDDGNPHTDLNHGYVHTRGQRVSAYQGSHVDGSLLTAPLFNFYDANSYNGVFVG